MTCVYRKPYSLGVDITAPPPLALYLPPPEAAVLREVLERPNSHARFRIDAHSPFQLHRSNVAATRTRALCIVSVTDLLLSRKAVVTRDLHRRADSVTE